MLGYDVKTDDELVAAAAEAYGLPDREARILLFGPPPGRTRAGILLDTPQLETEARFGERLRDLRPVDPEEEE